MAKAAVVFPGQGSQYVGMGQAFWEASQEAREVLAAAEQASGLPLQRLILEGPLEELTQTVNLQPAMVAVDLMAWRALARAGLRPLAVAGHSLGEYPALVAAGALDEARCLELVALRARLMGRDAAANPGAMAAIMGLAPEEVAGLCQDAGGVVQPANYNSIQQTVITGESQAVAAAGKLAKERGAKAIPLKVSGAWHSPLMAAAGQEMAQALAELELAEPRCPHFPNTTGEPTTDPAVIKAELQKQLTSPVRWVQTVEGMAALGAEAFIECGPKNVLAGLIKKTLSGAAVLGVEDPEGAGAALNELGHA